MTIPSHNQIRVPKETFSREMVVLSCLILLSGKVYIANDFIVFVASVLFGRSFCVRREEEGMVDVSSFASEKGALKTETYA